jgi:hypothetical protein
MTETMGPQRGIGPADSCMNDARAWRRLTRLPYRLRCTPSTRFFLMDGIFALVRLGSAEPLLGRWAEILVMLSELYPGESLMNMSFRASSRKDLDP